MLEEAAPLTEPPHGGWLVGGVASWRLGCDIWGGAGDLGGARVTAPAVTALVARPGAGC